MESLYEFYWDCGRNGELEGIFLATQEKVNALIGKEVYFGEVLGKHPEIYGTIKKEDIKLVTDNQDFLIMAFDLGVCLESGYNPFDYYTCRECEEPLDVITEECENCTVYYSLEEE